MAINIERKNVEFKRFLGIVANFSSYALKMSNVIRAHVKDAFEKHHEADVNWDELYSSGTEALALLRRIEDNSKNFSKPYIEAFEKCFLEADRENYDKKRGSAFPGVSEADATHRFLVNAGNEKDFSVRDEFFRVYMMAFNLDDEAASLERGARGIDSHLFKYEKSQRRPTLTGC